MDPLEYDLALAHQQAFYPLGFTLELATNAPAVLAAAEESWTGSQRSFDKPALRMRVVVDADGGAAPRVPVYKAQGHLLMIVADAGNFAVCDHTRRFAYGRLSAAAARDRRYVGYYFLEALVYHTLTQLYVTPVHAACVSRNGRGALLCGDAGAGKSTLACACARQGWSYLTDNDSWLLRESAEPIVLANPQRIRFRESAAELFPELRSRLPGTDFQGKKSLLVPTAEMAGVSTERACRAAWLLFLDRGPAACSALEPMAADEAFRRLADSLPLYAEDVRREQLASLRRLCALPAFTLRYRNTHDALRQLERLPL